MSTTLKHRRGGDEKYLNLDGLEDDQFRTKHPNDGRNPALVEEKLKQRKWQRVKLWYTCIMIISLIVLRFVVEMTESKKPKLPVINVDIDIPDADDWLLIHIVQSRFMQEQGPLEILGLARLKLFLTFCLPSMIQQTSQDFFWIIKTDPGFTKTAVFDMLVQSVQSHNNIYVVASNANFVFGSSGREGSWRDGKECLDLLQSEIFTGDIDRLRAAIALRNERPVLETRLDADDGLHANFIEYIQDTALERFNPSEVDTSTPNWVYWCSRRHIEWHSDTDSSLSEKQKANMGSVELGYMNVIQHDKLCVTPGITIGYNTNGNDSKNDISVPQYDHDKLYKNVRNSLSCYSDENGNEEHEMEANEEILIRGPCLELVEDFLFCAIRSRTWTSAGMYDINLDGKNGGHQEKELTGKLWALSEKCFGVTEMKVKETQDFLIRNKKEIARENLIGQCSTGHSCKDSAKEKLRQIVDSDNIS